MAYNPYFDEANIKKGQDLLQKTLQPQIQAGINKVSSTVNPYARGSMGASLLREVYQPAQQQYANYALGQHQAGTQFAAEAPFREAGLTGMYGGQQTMQGQQLADALKTSALNRQWYPSQYTGYGPEGQATLQREQMGINQQLALLNNILSGNLTPQQGTTVIPGYDITTEQEQAKQSYLPEGIETPEMYSLYLTDRKRFAQTYPQQAMAIMRSKGVDPATQSNWVKWFEFNG